jgi:hypothetical protein
MQVRHTRHGDGPQLQTSLPQTHPDYALRMEQLAIYTANLYAKLLEYGQTGYAPTTDGAYRDLFTYGSPSRTTDAYVHGTPAPDEIANTGFNLIIKLREHEGGLFLVAAPTATTAEQNTLRQAVTDIQPDWESLYGKGSRATLPAVAIVYHWLPGIEPEPGLWPAGIRHEQYETGLFHAVPQQ